MKLSDEDFSRLMAETANVLTPEGVAEVARMVRNVEALDRERDEARDKVRELELKVARLEGQVAGAANRGIGLPGGEG